MIFRYFLVQIELEIYNKINNSLFLILEITKKDIINLKTKIILKIKIFNND
jgi:hypothetical protein